MDNRRSRDPHHVRVAVSGRHNDLLSLRPDRRRVDRGWLAEQPCPVSHATTNSAKVRTTPRYGWVGYSPTSKYSLETVTRTDRWRRCPRRSPPDDTGQISQVSSPVR